MAADQVGAAAAKPVLRGVVFDMDGTLTELNLDFAEMKRRIGVRV
jgi:phosphoserine phosphatase